MIHRVSTCINVLVAGVRSVGRDRKTRGEMTSNCISYVSMHTYVLVIPTA